MGYLPESEASSSSPFPNVDGGVDPYHAEPQDGQPVALPRTNPQPYRADNPEARTYTGPAACRGRVVSDLRSAD
jgi:hypothetical protein